MADSPAQDAQPAQPPADQNAKPEHGTISEHPKEKRERAYALFAAGKQSPDISFELRIPIGTLYSWAKRDCWDARKQLEQSGIGPTEAAKAAKALAIKPASNAETQTSAQKDEKQISIRKPSGLDFAEKQTHYQEQLGEAAIRLADHLATLDGDAIVSQADKLLKADQIARKALKLESEKPSTVIQIGILAQPQAEKRSEMAAAKAVVLDVDAGVTPVPDA